MPEKSRVPGCGKSCVRCWRNKLKYGNKLKKKNFPKQNMWYISEKEWNRSDEELSDDEDISFVQEYFNTCVTINYKGKPISFNCIYDDYNNWLSENKQIRDNNQKQFIRELRQYVDSCYLTNNGCKIRLESH